MTHGSPELDEDAAKLIALGQDPGPEVEDFDPPLRQVQCEACQGEGRIYHGVRGGNDPDEWSETCRACSGDGCTVEEVEPNTVDEYCGRNDPDD